MNQKNTLAIALTLCLGTWGHLSQAGSGYSEEQLERSTRGLIDDVERIVHVRQTLGWYADEEAYRDVRDAMFRSVCKALPEVRERALTELSTAVMEAGNVIDLYEQRGRRMTSEVARARELQRRYDLLFRAMREAPRDCPFWDEPSIEFEGRQTDRNRFTLNLETGGLLQVRQTEGSWTYGGGGAGRILAGYGFGGTLTLLVGGEFGGGALLVPGSDPTQFAINYFPAVPVVLRWHRGNLHYDLEAAPMAQFQADDTTFTYGGRVAIGGGFSALRTQGLMPWAGLAVAYEQFGAGSDRPLAHFVRGGIRVGFVWDP